MAQIALCHYGPDPRSRYLTMSKSQAARFAPYCGTHESGARVMARRKVFRFPVILTMHVFVKLRMIDISLREFEQLLYQSEVVEQRGLADGQLKEVILTLSWTRPLHVVIIVDEARGEGGSSRCTSLTRSTGAPAIAAGGTDALRPL